MLLLLVIFPGGSLVDVLTNRSSALPVDVICRILWQTCRAVQHMHSQQPPVIHRDLKVMVLKSVWFAYVVRFL